MRIFSKSSTFSQLSRSALSAHICTQRSPLHSTLTSAHSAHLCTQRSPLHSVLTSALIAHLCTQRSPLQERIDAFAGQKACNATCPKHCLESVAVSSRSIEELPQNEDDTEDGVRHDELESKLLAACPRRGILTPGTSCVLPSPNAPTTDTAPNTSGLSAETKGTGCGVSGRRPPVSFVPPAKSPANGGIHARESEVRTTEVRTTSLKRVAIKVARVKRVMMPFDSHGRRSESRRKSRKSKSEAPSDGDILGMIAAGAGSVTQARNREKRNCEAPEARGSQNQECQLGRQMSATSSSTVNRGQLLFRTTARCETHSSDAAPLEV